MLWAVKAEIFGVQERIREILIKVDDGLDSLMGLSNGLVKTIKFGQVG